MTITRSDIARELVPGLNAIFGTEYNRYENEYLVLFDSETSDRAFEEEVLFTGFGSAPFKAEGASYEFDSAQESYAARYTHYTMALGFRITQEAIEDNLYDTGARRLTKMLGRSMKNATEVNGAAVYNLGYTADGTRDGVALFSSAHPTVQAGNLSNILATAADLSETSLEQAGIDIGGFLDDRGLPVAAIGESLHIPRQLEYQAERILKSPGRVGTADNDLNALKNLGKLPKGYFINHRFTGTRKWYIRTDIADGMKHFERVAVKTKMTEDPHTGDLMYVARLRESFGYSDWRGVYGSGNLTG